MYRVKLSDKALEDASKLMNHELQAYKKWRKLMIELEIHSTTGTGRPERLKGDKSGLWSRRITDRHRLIYSIHDDVLTVYVLSSARHYDDK